MDVIIQRLFELQIFITVILTGRVLNLQFLRITFYNYLHDTAY